MYYVNIFRKIKGSIIMPALQAFLPIDLSKNFEFDLIEGLKMKEKDIIKTIFSFFIIDLIIFAIIAGIIAFVMGFL